MSTLKICLAKFEVIPTNRSRVWTCLVHFTTNFVIFVSKMTSQWQSEPDFHLFLQKSIMSALEICLAKFEVIPTHRSWVSFSESIKVNYYFLSSDVLRCDEPQMTRKNMYWEINLSEVEILITMTEPPSLEAAKYTGTKQELRCFAIFGKYSYWP